jgi:SNF2 family DNA or RNA helicase
MKLKQDTYDPTILEHEHFWTNTLMPFQKHGIKHVIEHHGRRMIADEMGLGKTLQAIAIIIYYIRKHTELPALIICPASVKFSWITTIQQYFPTIQTNNITKSTDTFNNSAINIISYNMITMKDIQTQLNTTSFKQTIVDESHYIKNPNAIRSKIVIAICKSTTRCILLSGTPLNHPNEIYTQAFCIHPFVFPTFFTKHDPTTFANRYCKPTFNKRFHKYEFKGAQHLHELHLILQRYILIRRLKLNVLTNLPDKYRERIYLELSTDEFLPTTKKRKLDYDDETKTQEQDQEWIYNELVYDESVFQKREFMERFRLTAQFKLNAVIQYINEITLEQLSNDESLKIIIWAHHKFVLDALEENINTHKHINYIRIDGSVSPEKRGQLVHTFQTDPSHRIAILSIMAMQTGVTLTAAKIAIFTEFPFGPDVLLQAEDRIYRIGQTSDVLMKYLIYPKGTDRSIWRILNEKFSHSSSILDGERKTITFKS